MNHVIELGILDVVILRFWIDYVWFDGLIGLMLCYSYVYNLGIGSDKGILCHLFLFTIVVEALGALLSKAKESNLIRGVLKQGIMEKQSHIFSLQMIQFCSALLDGKKLLR